MRMKKLGAVIGTVALACLSIGFVAMPAQASVQDPVCVPEDAVYEDQLVTEAWEEEVIITPAYWQRYSWVGGPIEEGVTPTWSGPDDENWQANVKGDPHGQGVEGAYDTGTPGNANWFYLDRVPAVVDIIEHDAVYEEVLVKEAILCEWHTWDTGGFYPDANGAGDVGWPQDYVGPGQIAPTECESTYQQDLYRGTRAEIDALYADGVLDGPNPPEDHALVVDWEFVSTDLCPPPVPDPVTVNWTYENSCQDLNGVGNLEVVGAKLESFTWNGEPWAGDVNDFHEGTHEDPLNGHFELTFSALEGYTLGDWDGVKVIDINYKSANDCQVPDVPTMYDPCGLDNIIVSIPDDTDSVYYEWYVNKWGATIVTAHAKEGYSFPEGTVTWWKFKDSGERCKIPLPQIDVYDACGAGNLYVDVWDGYGFDFVTTYNEDGSVDVVFELLANYEFDGEFNLIQHFVEENTDECPPPVIVTPEPPVLVDPCGPDNYTVTIPEETEAYFYDSWTEGGITTVAAIAFEGYAFDEEGNWYIEWSFEDSGTACPEPPVEEPPAEEPPSLSETGFDGMGGAFASAAFLLAGTALLVTRRLVRR